MSQSTKKNIGEKYQKVSQYTHIIKRPDTYVGSINPEKDTHYIYNEETQNIDYKEINVIPGLYKIFDEIIVNAIDNKNRIENLIEVEKLKGLKKMTRLDVNFKRIKIKTDDGTEEEKWGIEVKNNGEGIDVDIHPTEKVWVPDMIFSHLLTSTNYDDTEKKITGGKNGYGAKLTNIYSYYFCVETVDTQRKRHCKCEYFNRMLDKREPVITENYSKQPFTSVLFVPYYPAFHINDLTDDMINLFKKRVYDMVYCGFGKINVYMNGNKLCEQDKFPLKTYIRKYISNVERPIFECSPHKRWLISVCLNDDFNFRQVSFVNGIYTIRGGKHVDYVVKKICKSIVSHIKTKKKITISDKFVKDNLMIFVNSIIENPNFDGQTKETLKTTSANFGSKFELPDDFIKKIVESSGIVQRAIEQSKFQESQIGKENDGKKTRFINKEQLDDAEWAGTNKSAKCTLILTEGLSAKSMAVNGLSVIENGHKLYGIFPLRGKLLNTRDKTASKITKNSEITNIKQILGLKENVD
jgi:DNA topoisomerase-2